MSDSRLLFDAFSIYYEKGMEALDRSNYEVARRNINCAAETLYKLAKESNGILKEKRVKRADELAELAKRIENKQREAYVIKNNASNDAARLGIVEAKPKSTNSKVKKDEDLTEFLPAEKTGVTFDDVAGLEEVKNEIKKQIIEPRLHPEIYKKFKKDKGGGILLYGVPGTGKTMIAQAIANEIDAKFFSIKCSDIASRFFGDSEQNIKNLFAEAKKYPCSIVFFDEFEALGTKRDTYSTVMKRVVPELLAQMQGFEKNDNTLLIIAATNRPWDIDPAFMRAGRIGTHIYVPLPDEDARRAIITKKLEDVPTVENIDMDRMIQVTNGFNGADVANFCNRLKDFAIDRSIQGGLESPINNDDIDATVQIVKSTVDPNDVKKIAEYEKAQGLDN